MEYNDGTIEIDIYLQEYIYIYIYNFFSHLSAYVLYSLKMQEIQHDATEKNKFNSTLLLLMD